MANLTSIDSENATSVGVSGPADGVENAQSIAAGSTHAQSNFGLNVPLKGRRVVVNRESMLNNNIFAEGETKDAKIAISAYKNLRTRIVQRLNEIGANSFMVCGAAQNVGKTLTSINLALAFARRTDKQIILVDMDLRSPSVHHVLGFESRGCILDVASGAKKMSEVLVDPGVENLLIIPGLDRHEDSSEAIVSKEMRELMAELHQLPNTIVIYDTPPVLGCDDVVAVSQFMEAALFVVSEKTTTKKELADSLSMLTEITLLGITMNRSSEGNFSTYYY